MEDSMIKTDESPKTIRVCVLSVVKHDYLPKAIAAHPRFELVCVADDASRPDWTHERNQSFADAFHIPYIRDIQKAFNSFSLDAVVVSPEAERHCELSRRAAKSGLHIVVDKPLSISLEECDELIDVIEKNKVQCLVWNRNFLPALIQAQNAIKQNLIGNIVSIHCDFYFSKDAGPALSNKNENRDKINWLDRQLEAHKDGSDGGVGIQPIGELQIEGIYPLAYIHFLTDGLIAQSVFARTTSHFHQAHFDNNVDDLASVSLELDNDVTATLSIGRIGAASHPDIGEIKLHIIGSLGAMVISEARPEISVYYKSQPPNEFKNRRIADDNNYLLAENFAKSIDGTEKPVLDVYSARNICACVLAAIESGKSARKVTIKNRHYGSKSI